MGGIFQRAQRLQGVPIIVFVYLWLNARKRVGRVAVFPAIQADLVGQLAHVIELRLKIGAEHAGGVVIVFLIRAFQLAARHAQNRPSATMQGTSKKMMHVDAIFTR